MKKTSALIILLISTITHGSYRVKDGQVILDSLEGYSLCQRRDRSGQYCQDGLDRFIKNKPELAWKAAILTRKMMNHWVALPYFWLAKESKEFDCSNPDLLLAIKASYSLSKEQEKTIDKAHQIAFTQCRKEIPSKLDGVLKNSNTYIFKKYCNEFVNYKIIKGVSKKKCLK